jgi:predicted kinase
MRTPKLLLLIGAPGAGKTTFAKALMSEDKDWLRLSRDDFRSMNFTDGFYKEKLISEIFDNAILIALKRNCNVIVDATNCKAKYLNHYIKKFNGIAEISFELFECETDELIARCKKRCIESGRDVPEDVIKRFVSELEHLKQTFDFSPRHKKQMVSSAVKQDISLPKAIICDLDGTLALNGNRNPYDASSCDNDDLNESVANVLKLFAADGYNILLLSGREERFREPTLRFLMKFNIPYNHLWMRATEDFRKDSIVKHEIFNREIANKFYIEFVLDDRDQVVEMWRTDFKLNCFQVNYGNF